MRIVPLVVVAGMIACAPEPHAAKDAAPYNVEGGFITDEQERVVVLRGVNLSGHHKNAPYFDYHQPADYRMVREQLGMNSIRFLIEWAAVEPSPDHYDNAYLADVKERMGWAKDAGLLVVVDMHQDLYGEGFPGGNGAPAWTCDASHYAGYEPQTDWYLGYLDAHVIACFDHLWTDDDLQDHYARAWRHVAEALVDNDAILGFEVINEPWLGSFALDAFELSALQPFYEKVIAAVRKEAPQWLAFVEPMSMSNLGRDSQLGEMPFHNVVYAPHSYDSATESGHGFNATNHAAALDKLAKLQAEARRMNAALWIGEYGGPDTVDGIGAYMDGEYDAFASVFAGSSYWDYSRGEGFGIMAEDGTEKQAMWDVLVRPAPERIAGSPGAWTYDDATRTLTVTFTAKGDAPSLLRAPARTYPNGVTVQCTQCDASVKGDVVTVTAPDGAAVRVVITPAP